jgi:LacI family gluconate utilization system Gnt-I transcriptional repressor
MSTARGRRGVGRPTMAEVARLAGVSMSTVSRMLRDPDAVSDGRAARVADAVRKLGYVPNLMAGGLATARAPVIGVVLPSIRNAFFAATVDALADAVEPDGWTVIDSSANYDPDRETRQVRALLAWSPVAMVLTGLGHAAETVALVRQAGVPVVEMWDIDGVAIDLAVGFSPRAVGRDSARHLLAAGRRRIPFVGAMLDRDGRAAQRAEGYRDAMLAAGALPEVMALPGASTVAQGVTAARALLDRHPPPDAVYFSNDVLALGALFEFRRRGVAVPGDIAVMGFGDLDFAAHADPPLTTVRPPREAIGRVTAEIVRARVAGQPVPETRVDLGFELVARMSA